jgi:hypothetical protein
MTMSETDDDDEHKRICCDCVGEEYLSKEIATSGKSRECDYCGAMQKCWSIEDLADAVDRAFEEHYVKSDTWLV